MEITKEVTFNDHEYTVVFEVSMETKEDYKHPDDPAKSTIKVPVFKRIVSINGLSANKYFTNSLITDLGTIAIKDLEYEDLYI